ncbi:hypothetical protein M8J77_023370 [Diaphorina citri]|nr:hypothetical protein M8J77_023370 [Diaphorina citri]
MREKFSLAAENGTKGTNRKPSTPAVRPKEEVQKTKLAKFVKNWNKFLELIKIFNSTSPRDIEDSWNCGRGPLAQEFSPGEVKNLIRALIQASARREALLEKIN